MASSAYFFVFGRTPRLALLELQSLYPSVSLFTPEIARMEASKPIEHTQIIGAVGGTVKLAVEVERTDSLNAADIIRHIVSGVSRVNFGISYYNIGQIPKSLAADIKRECENRGIHARFVTPQHGSTLSTVSVDKSHLTELLIIKHTDGYHIAKTLAVQPYEEWSVRDYGRPYADAKSGMLPPKVARMIANIARGLTRGTGNSFTLYDPFCGMGTILAEAYMSSWNVMGSDTSEDVVLKAQKNLNWITEKYPDTGGKFIDITVRDAVHVAEFITKDSIDAIVTEPFMGSTSIATRNVIDPSKVKNIIKGLEKLYIGCLREWKKILKPGGVILIALPAYSVGGREYFVKKVVDMCENLGYTIEVGPIEYSRPQAIVKRQFFVFRKHS
jgi:tRNA G10  N-methylase Trm11